MKLAINGFGRIGRSVFKIAFDRPGMEIGAINDLAGPEMLAYLLKHDSTYGVYARNVGWTGTSLKVDDVEIPVTSRALPAEIPWKDSGIHVVVESTGQFCSAEGPSGGYRDHVRAGADKVILTAPAADEIGQTIVPGVNDEELDREVQEFSAANSTTHCLAVLAGILHGAFGLEQGFATTVHAWTNDQVLVDQPHEDVRKARSAVQCVIPATTRAAETVGLVVPELEGRLKAMALRVPVPVGSVVDLVARVGAGAGSGAGVSVEDVHSAVREAAQGALAGIVEYSEAPLVSTDIRGNSHSAVYDAGSTMVLDDNLVKILAWYDNEFAFATRVVDLAQKLS